MFNLVQKRRWYFILSAVLLAIGLLAMVYSTITIGSPLRLSIDFVGGSLLEVALEEPAPTEAVRDVVVDAGFADPVVNTVADDRTFLIRTKEMNAGQKDALVERLEGRFGPVTERRYESVGPTIGRETTRSAGLAIAAASLAMLAARNTVAANCVNAPLALRVGWVSDSFANLNYAYRDYGVPYCFINTWVNKGIDEPKQYSREKILGIFAEDELSDRDCGAATAEPTSSTTPTNS